MVAQVLSQASTVQAAPDGSYEMYDYIISLREGIMDAWAGIIVALKDSNQGKPGRLNYVLVLMHLSKPAKALR